jgi:hypothetical protein
MINFTVTMSNRTWARDRGPIYEVLDRFVFARSGENGTRYRAGINVRSQRNSTVGNLRVRDDAWPAAVRAELLLPYANDPRAWVRAFNENSDQGFVELLSELAAHIEEKWIVQAFNLDLRLDDSPLIRAREWQVTPGTRDVQVTDFTRLPRYLYGRVQDSTHDPARRPPGSGGGVRKPIVTDV